MSDVERHSRSSRRGRDDRRGYDGNRDDDDDYNRGFVKDPERRHRSRDRGHGRRSRSPQSSNRRRPRSRSPDDDRSRRRRQHSREKPSSYSRKRKNHGFSYDGDRNDSDKQQQVARLSGERDDRGSIRTGRSTVRQRGPLPSQNDSFAVASGGEPEKPKEKANFGNTGLLAAASNAVAQADGSSITLKYHEPPEARKPPPRDQWKLFVFKDEEIVDTVDLSARSCWLVGRESAVVDLPAEHPSISKQHAVVQFRHIEKRNEFGDKIGKVKPYLIDLDSANGTKLNDKTLPSSRYLELRDKDMIQLGHSSREYVVMLAPRG